MPANGSSGPLLRGQISNARGTGVCAPGSAAPTFPGRAFLCRNREHQCVSHDQDPRRRQTNKKQKPSLGALAHTFLTHVHARTHGSAINKTHVWVCRCVCVCRCGCVCVQTYACTRTPVAHTLHLCIDCNVGHRFSRRALILFYFCVCRRTILAPLAPVRKPAQEITALLLLHSTNTGCNGCWQFWRCWCWWWWCYRCRHLLMSVHG